MVAVGATVSPAVRNAATRLTLVQAQSACSIARVQNLHGARPCHTCTHLQLMDPTGAGEALA